MAAIASSEELGRLTAMMDPYEAAQLIGDVNSASEADLWAKASVEVLRQLPGDANRVSFPFLDVSRDVVLVHFLTPDMPLGEVGESVVELSELRNA